MRLDGRCALPHIQWGRMSADSEGRHRKTEIEIEITSLMTKKIWKGESQRMKKMRKKK